MFVIKVLDQVLNVLQIHGTKTRTVKTRFRKSTSAITDIAVTSSLCFKTEQVLVFWGTLFD